MSFARRFGYATVASAATGVFGYGVYATWMWRRFENGYFDSRFSPAEVEADPSLTGLLKCWYTSPGQLREPHAVRPALESSPSSPPSYDVCVIGGGIAGLHAAVALAERGKSVCVLEARRIASGASGRNGGQLLASFEDDTEMIADVCGDDIARSMVDDSVKIGTERTMALIDKYAIDCGLRKSHVLAVRFANGPESRGQTVEDAVKEDEEHLADRFRRFGERWTALGIDKLREVGFVSDRFVFGADSPEGAELNPMALCFGLARVVEQLGGRIHEHTAVKSVTRADADAPAIVTAANGATVAAKEVVLATGGAPASISPALAACTTKASTAILVTKPMPREKVRAVLRPNVVVFDERFHMNYFRVVGGNDDRIMFGGIGSGVPLSDDAIVDELKEEFHRTFPSLWPNFAVEWVWQGAMNMRFPGAPLIGREGDAASPGGNSCRRMWYALAFGGHGLAAAAAAGELIASAITDDGKYIETVPSSSSEVEGVTSHHRYTAWQKYTHVPEGYRHWLPSLPLFGTWVGCLGVDLAAKKLHWEDTAEGRCDP